MEMKKENRGERAKILEGMDGKFGFLSHKSMWLLVWYDWWISIGFLILFSFPLCGHSLANKGGLGG